MGFKFEKPQKAKAEKKAVEAAQLTDHQKEYRDTILEDDFRCGIII